jgi:hypothetical protein
MIRVLILISFFTFPAYLRAATIDVISGEHADFSRLVFQYPDAEEWAISKFDEGYFLETASGSYDYNVKKVFDLIPQTRILKLESTPDGSLKIFTKPGFHLDAFDLRAGRLVVDIKDGPASVGSKFELPKEQKSQTNAQVDSQTDSVAIDLSAGRTLRNLLTFNDIANGALLPILPDPESAYTNLPLENDYFSANIDPLGKQNLRVLEMEDALFGQISRAVSQGLLEADLPGKENAVEATKRLQSTPQLTTEPAAPKIPLQPEVEDKIHVRVRTATDRDQKQPTSSQTGMTDLSCPAETLLAIETWGEPPQDGLLLSEFRSSVLGEFDQSLTQGVEKLAKYYLYLSFGAEAKMVLNEFGVFAPNAQFLRLIADVMDEGYSDSYGLLSDFSQCPGSTAFWAIAAREDLSDESNIPSEQIASYFSALPLHLRQHLGPQLSERFLEIGDLKTARVIQNALSRVEAIHGDAFDLLSAEMQLVDGNIDQAISTLTDISREDGPSAAEALIRSIDVRTEQGRNIDQKTAELAEVLMIEHRGTSLESDLARVSILARIFSGDPSVALEALARQNTQNLLTVDDQMKLVNAATVKFTLNFDDLMFAKEALMLNDTGANKYLTDDTKSQIAKRMLSIGFPDLATRFANFDEELTNSKRLLLGQIAMQNGNQTDALIYLLGAEGQDAALMRAELYLELDMPEKAAEEFALTNQQVAADDANFLAEDWGRLSTSEDKKFAMVADHLNDEMIAPAIDKDITISAAQDLLNRSQTSRAIFDDLVK